MLTMEFLFPLFAFITVDIALVACTPISAKCNAGICPSTEQATLISPTTNYRFNNIASSVSTPQFGNVTTAKPSHKKEDHKKSEGIKVAKLDFNRVETPYVVCLWILLASLAKIAFHLSQRMSSLMPESCLLILLGVPIGLILRALGMRQQTFYFTSNLFFLFLLPPIILDAGYFMPVRAFYLNIGTILLYATVGTIFNAFAVGSMLYAVQGITSIQYSLMHALLFGSLISAVDPVAVLAVFEEVHVHEVLYILVFGESVLNDAASVVLYHTFEAMANMSVITFKQVVLAFVSFFVISVGGTIIGVIWGIATSFVTRFTEHVRVIEPLFIFVMPYMAYLTAEIFHFSGIMSILFCGIIMKPYVESNVSRKSHTTIKYFLKLLSTCCETIIFMFLGVSLVMSKHTWNAVFIIMTLIFILIVRFLGVMLLTAIANWFGRIQKIGRTEQFIMSYGGLRGAVAFCLAILLDKKHMSSELREMLITTTMVVVLFTVFVQGTTIKPLVRFLKVRRKEKQEITMTCVINDRILDHVSAGFEEVLGHHGHGYWREMIDHLNKKYFRRWLERDPDQALDEEIMLANRKINYKCALSMAENPSALFQKTDEWSAVKRNPSYAVALALRENCEITENQPALDTGALLGRGHQDEVEEGMPHSLSFVIPRARAPKLSARSRTLSTRKYTLAALDEPDDEIPYRHCKVKRNALAHMRPASLRSRSDSDHEPSRKHKHHHRHRRRRNDVSETGDIKPKSKSPLAQDPPEPPEEPCSGDRDDGISFKAHEVNEDIEQTEVDALVRAETLPPIPLSSEPVKDSRADELRYQDETRLEDVALLHRNPEEPQQGSGAEAHSRGSLKRQHSVGEDATTVL